MSTTAAGPASAAQGLDSFPTSVVEEGDLGQRKAETWVGSEGWFRVGTGVS